MQFQLILIFYAIDEGRKQGNKNPLFLPSSNARTAGAWTYYLFQKFQNAIFLEIFQISASGLVKLV